MVAATILRLAKTIDGKSMKERYLRQRTETTRPALPLSRGACDCHVHVFGSADVYPCIARSDYTPHPAWLDELDALHASLGIERRVLVQPSVYGYDNRALIDAMRASTFTSRGVVVLRADTPVDEIAGLHAIGVRGVRFNLVNGLGAVDIEDRLAEASRLSASISDFGWHVQFNLTPGHLALLDRWLPRISGAIVLDHVALLRSDGAPADARLDALLDLVNTRRCWIKLSGLYRATMEPFPHANLAAPIRRLAREVPERLVWGSDWPHPMLSSQMPDDGTLIDCVRDWTQGAFERILTRNPTELYDFPDLATV